MGLLELLRPDETRGWDSLDERGQLLLLRRAQRSGHLPTLRMLAELRTLTGEARTQLLAEREPTIRKRTLARRDLTEQEAQTLYNSETRASVLAAAADSIPDDRLDTLLDIAENSRGTSLVEALLRRGRLDANQQLRMLRVLADRKPYNSLASGVADTVLRKIPPDSGLILWVLSDVANQRHGLWNIRQLLNRVASQTQTAEQADTLLSALVAAGHTQPALSLAERLLDSSSVLSASAPMPVGEVAALYSLLERRLSDGNEGWGAMRAGVGRLLAQLHPLLPGNQVADDAAQGETPEASVPEWESATTSEIAAALAGEQPLDPLSIARLACNPNHTDETARKLATLVGTTAGASLEVLDRFDRVVDLVWTYVSQGTHGAGTVSADQALERMGVERLSQTLATPRFRGDTRDSRHWWRHTWPLMNTSPLSWLLSDVASCERSRAEERLQVALALPLQHTLRGDEALAFRLLAGQVGDDAAMWDVVDGLADQWDGSYNDLLHVAQKVNS